MADRTVILEDARKDLDELLRIVPAHLWLTKYKALTNSWPHLDLVDFKLRRHSVEIAIGRALEADGSVSRIGQGDLDAIDQDALIFGHLAMCLARKLPEPRRIADSLRGHLNKNGTLRTFLFELETFNTLEMRGFDVRPVDLLGENQFDFMVTKDGKQVAVECKHISGDTGMVVAKPRALELFDRIANFAKRKRIQLKSRHIAVKIPAKLDDLEAVAKLCYAALLSSANQVEEFARVELTDISEETQKAIARTHLGANDPEVRHEAIDSLLGIPHSSHLYIWGDPETVIAFSLSSQAATNPMPQIFDYLRDYAKRQLPDEIPGALMVEIAELESGDAGFFSKRPENDALAQYVTDFFARRPHVYGLVFVSGARNIGIGHPWDSGDGCVRRPTLIFRNEKHPDYNNSVTREALGPLTNSCRDPANV